MDIVKFKPTVYIISDSTGETAQTVVNAALSQFDSDDIKLKLFAHIESKKDITGIISQINKEKGFIVYTIVKPELRVFLKEESEKQSVVSFDMFGPIMENIERVSGIRPKLEAGIIRKLDKEYFKLGGSYSADNLSNTDTTTFSLRGYRPGTLKGIIFS